MRFVSTLTRSVEWFAPLMLLLVLGGSACENKHIGRPCELAVGDAGAPTGSGTTATIDVGLECPSRICLLPAEDVRTTTGSLCTADCTSDDDCADGELRNPKDPSDFRCSHGFTCKVAVTVGDFCCRKMCVCKDFLNIPMGGFTTPVVCAPTPENKAMCQNIK
jgi:hypothetical protein